MKIELGGCIAALIATITAWPVLAEPFHRKLELQGVTFDVSAPNDGSTNKLTIAVEGLKRKTAPIEREVEGTVTGAEVADLDRNRSPEIYVYVTSAGSGAYGSLIALAANRKTSLSNIFLPDLTDDKKLSAGSMGHDEFSIVENVLGRRFPIYKLGDTNAQPTGGMRQISYKLTPGEAGWILRVTHADTF